MNYNKKACLSTAALAGLVVAGGAAALELQVGESKVDLYGYAKLDVIYDVHDDLGISVDHNAITLGDERSSKGHATLHAYESRLGVGTSTPVQGRDLKTVIEGDFYGSGGGTFRLRHAYGEWNGLLAGQTWTNFHGFVAATPTVSFTGLGGMPNTARQAQLRYTVGNVSVALEDPEKLGGREEADGDDKSRFPDLTLRYTERSGAFRYSASAVLRHLGYDAEGQDDSTMGWGVAVEAAYDLSPAITVRGGLTHGDGIGGYLNENPRSTPAVQAGPAFVTADGRLETIESTGGTLGVSIAAGPGAINAAYYRTTSELDATHFPGDTSDTRESLFLNYIWSPAERIRYGIEAGWHSREVLDGRDGDAVRLQGMVQYSF